MDRQPNTQSLQWFVDRNAAGELELNPPFQRRSVWSLDYQRYFVDTLMRDYPSPPIFLEIVIEPGAYAAAAARALASAAGASPRRRSAAAG